MPYDPREDTHMIGVTPVSPSTAERANADDIRQALGRILSSHSFGAAESQKAFLHYVVEQALTGMGGKIKEYEIATEVFGKVSSFDSRKDPIVRIQAGNLRLRLAKYYETEGCQDKIRIDLPKGCYAPEFVVQNPDDPGSQEAEQPSEAPVITPTAVAARELNSSLPGRRRRLIAVLVGVSVLCAAAAWFLVQRRHSAPAPEVSVVVIPFSNLSDSREDEFFSDGLTDELIDSLSQVPKLRVIGRTSSFQFRGKSIDIREIGQRLGVGAVLEGSVRRFGERFRVTAQLTDSKQASVLWSDSYESDTTDVLLVQKEIALAITQAFKGRFMQSPGSGVVPSRPVASNAKTPEAYLKARYFWAKNTPESLATAMEYLDEAIHQDPNFAPDYVGLASCYVTLPVLTGARSKDVVPKIKVNALKALGLDPSQAGAHIDLAMAATYGFDWATAEEEFRKGLALGPGIANAHHSYGTYLLLTGRLDEAIQQDNIALHLDPISPNYAQALARSMLFAGRLQDSIAEAQEALALDPNYGLAMETLGTAHLQKGMHSEAVRELERALELLGHGPGPTSHLAYAYARAGQLSEAHNILNQALKQFDQGSMPASAIARMYLGLQDNNRALDWLGTAINRQDINIFIKSDPVYDPLRGDPRFRDLLQRMKLAP